MQDLTIHDAAEDWKEVDLQRQEGSEEALGHSEVELRKRVAQESYICVRRWQGREQRTMEVLGWGKGEGGEMRGVPRMKELLRVVDLVPRMRKKSYSDRTHPPQTIPPDTILQFS